MCRDYRHYANNQLQKEAEKLYGSRSFGVERCLILNEEICILTMHRLVSVSVPLRTH